MTAYQPHWCCVVENLDVDPPPPATLCGCPLPLTTNTASRCWPGKLPTTRCLTRALPAAYQPPNSCSGHFTARCSRDDHHTADLKIIQDTISRHSRFAAKDAMEGPCSENNSILTSSCLACNVHPGDFRVSMGSLHPIIKSSVIKQLHLGSACKASSQHPSTSNQRARYLFGQVC